MCGIAGIISPIGVSSQQIVEMTDIVSHRGPDDEGFFIWKSSLDNPEIYGGKDTSSTVFEDTMLPYLPAHVWNLVSI